MSVILNFWEESVERRNLTNFLSLFFPSISSVHSEFYLTYESISSQPDGGTVSYKPWGWLLNVSYDYFCCLFVFY